ncbi:MAG: S1C family serine protease [Planctomycetia bacterium]|nr:S1C family serine protease [Planctomycetia bacterium]
MKHHKFSLVIRNFTLFTFTIFGFLIFCFPEKTVADTHTILDEAQPKMVKIYGAGGFSEMEGYQSGFFISENGHILTVFSYVLDTDDLVCVLHNGSKYSGTLLGADPILDLAVIKIDRENTPFYDIFSDASKFSDAQLSDLLKTLKDRRGESIFALSNLYNVAVGNEPVSVQHGIISAVVQLEARRKAYASRYKGPVYVLDAITNNPGAAGGALITETGEFRGILGKELKHSRTGAFLCFALPAEAFSGTVKDIMEGKYVARDIKDNNEDEKPSRSITLQELGITLLPDVVYRTPAYIDWVEPNSLAAKAGLQPDDLIVFISGKLVQSCKAVSTELEYIDHEDAVTISVIRGTEMIEVTLQKER